MTTILALALTLGASPAHAATGWEEWTQWATSSQSYWMQRYHQALVAAAAGNHRPMIALLEQLAEMLGVTTDQVRTLLQRAAVTGSSVLGLLFIDGHSEDRRAAEWGDVDGDEMASMRIDFPSSGNGRDGEGTVETDCIGGTDQYGNEVDCDEESWATIVVETETVHTAELGPLCLGHVSEWLAVAVAGECDEYAGQTVPVDYLIVDDD